jgi:hypothetical protein
VGLVGGGGSRAECWGIPGRGSGGRLRQAQAQPALPWASQAPTPGNQPLPGAPVGRALRPRHPNHR